MNEYKLLDVIPERKSFQGREPTLVGKEMNVRPSKLLKETVMKSLKRKAKELEDESEIEDFSCKQCEFTSNQVSDLKDHIETIHKNKLYSCDICE